MKENADKYLDDLTRKVLGKTTLEKPSLDFTSNVMTHINAITGASKFNYKPLISTPVWFLVGLLSVSGIAYILFRPESRISWMPNIDFGDLFDFSTLIPDLNLSQTTFYVIVLFAVMLGVQLLFLKHQLHKPFNRS